jgi:diadenosine tetraphosphate (Ap4A) HIT family hydrolase
MNDAACRFCVLREDFRRKKYIYKNTSKDGLCYAVLSIHPFTVGHTLVILDEHVEDVASDLSSQQLHAFMTAINEVSKHLKNKARNERNEPPQRIYACILSDGVTHLHAHLIPRYPFSVRDKKVYIQTFLHRDGPAIVSKNVIDNDLGGFWYLAEGEKNMEEKTEDYLRPLREKLRMTPKGR